MRPGTRACYGASTVGAFSGIALAVTGAIIILVETYTGQTIDYTIWLLVSVLCTAGFLVLAVSLFCCAGALCRHGSASEESAALMEKKIFNGRVHPQVWTTQDSSRPSWNSPSNSLPDQLEDLEDVNLEDMDPEPEPEPEHEPEAEPEPEEEPEPEPEPEPEEDPGEEAGDENSAVLLTTKGPESR